MSGDLFKAAVGNSGPVAPGRVRHERKPGPAGFQNAFDAGSAGLMAMIIRGQLFGPDNHIVCDSQYNELLTMHGTIMLLLFAT